MDHSPMYFWPNLQSNLFIFRRSNAASGSSARTSVSATSCSSATPQTLRRRPSPRSPRGCSLTPPSSSRTPSSSRLSLTSRERSRWSFGPEPRFGGKYSSRLKSFWGKNTLLTLSYFCRMWKSVNMFLIIFKVNLLDQTKITIGQLFFSNPDHA